ncbi:hypothetical protein SAMD00019534_111220 [Acytostelium subglobosum LB1]|uniref:hypothetical protein n=1 Tax=Acytostelium subglobosum LB1 TaxID=1410327 RepID=UPI0006448C0C|nr:hypothetical protein SAMD00019534_111220 [Acytostelium subglobosum LB1]GAM27946.1 hypothetical protein SAMD00019534_111220 [Acytostelium subglobosum LB1]|eukprot:XP_012749229.1 hypothetical protein SAMD00019534_111220 [Acytostelium subglobosum LB1]
MLPVTLTGASHCQWICQLLLPQSTEFEYIYVVQGGSGQAVTCREDRARRFTSPQLLSHDHQHQHLVIHNDSPLRISNARASWITTGLVGLEHKDFNCSLVSVVHLLFNFPKLRQRLIDTPQYKGRPYSSCLSTIFKDMEQGQQTDLAGLRSLVALSSDAGEILNIILCEVIDEISRSNSVLDNNNMGIRHMFEGDLAKTAIVLDRNGNIESVKSHSEKFVNIILPVRGFVSLEESLKVYQHNIEQVGTTTFETIVAFDNMPDVFVVQLDRAHQQHDHHHYTKVTNRFSFPKRFIPVNQTVYGIKAIICHQGDSLNDGHFFAYVRRGKQWLKCDGVSIEQVSRKMAFYDSFGGSPNDGQAYILVYEKQDGSPTGAPAP